MQTRKHIFIARARVQKHSTGKERRITSLWSAKEKRERVQEHEREREAAREKERNKTTTTTTTKTSKQQQRQQQWQPKIIQNRSIEEKRVCQQCSIVALVAHPFSFSRSHSLSLSRSVSTYFSAFRFPSSSLFPSLSRSLQIRMHCIIAVKTEHNSNSSNNSSSNSGGGGVRQTYITH